jgi:hypothetical protein
MNQSEIENIIALERAALEKYDEDFMDDKVTIDGLTFFVDEESYTYSTDMEQTATFEATKHTYTRTGRKEISYDRWVDTTWGEWD